MAAVGKLSAYGPQKGSLSAPVRSEKRDHMPGIFNRKGKMIQDLMTTHRDGEVLNGKIFRHNDQRLLSERIR